MGVRPPERGERTFGRLADREQNEREQCGHRVIQLRIVRWDDEPAARLRPLSPRGSSRRAGCRTAPCLQGWLLTGWPVGDSSRIPFRRHLAPIRCPTVRARECRGGSRLWVKTELLKASDQRTVAFCPGASRAPFARLLVRLGLFRDPRLPLRIGSCGADDGGCKPPGRASCRLESTTRNP